MAGPARRDVIGASIVAFVGGAVAPRLAYRLRWPSRLGARGLVVYTAAQAAVIFGVRFWLVPRLRQMAATRAVVADRLRARLGREPTEQEVIEEVLANDGRSFFRGGEIT